jgi:hypothetical protein
MMWLVWGSFGVTTVSAEVSEGGWIIADDSREAGWSGAAEEGPVWMASHGERKRTKRARKKMGFDEDDAHQRKLR